MFRFNVFGAATFVTVHSCDAIVLSSACRMTMLLITVNPSQRRLAIA